MKKYCSHCGREIENERFYKIGDNFIQVKYFDDDEENCFCSTDCLLNYLQVGEVENDEFYLCYF